MTPRHQGRRPPCPSPPLGQIMSGGDARLTGGALRGEETPGQQGTLRRRKRKRRVGNKERKGKKIFERRRKEKRKWKSK